MRGRYHRVIPVDEEPPALPGGTIIPSRFVSFLTRFFGKHFTVDTKSRYRNEPTQKVNSKRKSKYRCSKRNLALIFQPDGSVFSYSAYFSTAGLVEVSDDFQIKSLQNMCEAVKIIYDIKICCSESGKMKI